MCRPSSQLRGYPGWLSITRPGTPVARSSDQQKTFTARAITRAITSSEISDCAPISSLAQARIGITSFGLNAVLVVSG